MQVEGKKFFMAPSLAVVEGKLNTHKTTGWATFLNFDLVGQIGTVTIGYETAQTLMLRKILVSCGIHEVTVTCVFGPRIVVWFTSARRRDGDGAFHYNVHQGLPYITAELHINRHCCFPMRICQN